MTPTFVDILSQLFHDLEFTYYDDSCLSSEEAFESKFLDAYEAEPQLDPDAVAEDLDKQWRSDDQAAKEYACIARCCVFAVAAKQAYEVDREKAWAYLCRAQYEYGVTVAMISVPWGIVFDRKKQATKNITKRYDRYRAIEKHALNELDKLLREPGNKIKSASGAARELLKAVRKYAQDKHDTASSDNDDPFFGYDEPPSVSHEALRKWFKDVQFPSKKQ
ncbi:hypothetical protein [Paraburkholderia sp. BR10882]|uniref:hypothetical protein n=1 Tax=unclassified Paraburkholderia TaxID=2615204 RepID=UPI0034CD7321